jgi:hypothetical protein
MTQMHTRKITAWKINEIEAELQEEQEASVGDKLNCGLQQHAGSSRDSHRLTRHATGLRKCKGLTINME